MSLRYKGAVISATPPTTTGGESGVASGSWTLEQQFQAQGAGNWPTPAPDPSLFIENLFSTYLYTGNGSTQTITNGIDLSGKGGLVWIKNRTQANGHTLEDTARVGTYALTISSNSTAAQSSGDITGFTSSGFSLRDYTNDANASANNYASWTFRKQPKFFDVVTYTGNGVAGRQIAHNLGSTPGCIIVKATSNTAEGLVYHQSLGNTKYLTLFSTSTAAADTWSGAWNDTSPTSTHFTVGSGSNSNADGWTFVAYLFAHDAGGFGLTGTDNVISCGSYTGTGATLDVNLGYEVQFVLIKPTSVAGNWTMMDNMRGMTPVGVDGTARLRPNTSEAETALGGSYGVFPNATGFTVKSNTGVDDYNASGQTYIYIAIRRGPMKVPTSGTSVFSPVAYSPTDPFTVTTGFPVDAMFNGPRGIGSGPGFSAPRVWDRLRGGKTYLYAWLTNEENTDNVNQMKLDSNTGFVDDYNNANYGGAFPTIGWNFGRAPSFFDEVCYTGTGTAQNITHNLGVVPEMMIVKIRNSAITANWGVYHQAIGNTDWLKLNLTDAVATNVDIWNSTTPTSSVFSVGSATTNYSSGTYVAYLFATCAGVSKVGSYTGTATTLQVNCGFTGGARFVLIKRTDSTGDWYVWDSARGIVAGNDPYLLLNSTAAEVTSTDYVDTYSAGFEITSTAPAAINASGGTFIFLAIA